MAIKKKVSKNHITKKIVTITGRGGRFASVYKASEKEIACLLWFQSHKENCLNV